MARLLIACIVIGFAVGSDAGAQGPAGAGALAGRWKSTVVPPKGEGPMVDPEITIETKGGTTTVLMDAKGGPIAAAAFDGGKGAGTFLIVKTTMAGSGLATIVIRPAEAGRLRVEYFVEYPKNQNWYHTEVFVREK